jgi:hypothetical protein
VGAGQPGGEHTDSVPSVRELSSHPLFACFCLALICRGRKARVSRKWVIEEFQLLLSRRERSLIERAAESAEAGVSGKRALCSRRMPRLFAAASRISRFCSSNIRVALFFVGLVTRSCVRRLLRAIPVVAPRQEPAC